MGLVVLQVPIKYMKIQQKNFLLAAEAGVAVDQLVLLGRKKFVPTWNK